LAILPEYWQMSFNIWEMSFDFFRLNKRQFSAGHIEQEFLNVVIDQSCDLDLPAKRRVMRLKL
jgi:hypothetical protein